MTILKTAARETTFEVHFRDAVDPACATTSSATSCKRPPPISDRLSKTPKLSQVNPYSWNL